MTFFEAQNRLLTELRAKVRNGHLTEREMARLTGVSQPHIHNVLKGARNLSPEVADRILKTFHLSLLDLSRPDELHERFAAIRQRVLLVDVPLRAVPIGPNQPWRQDCSILEWLALPVPFDCKRTHLAAVRLEHDARMDKELGNCDLAVVKIAREPLLPLDPAGLYVIEISGGTAVRYLRSGANGVYVATAGALDCPGDWEMIAGANSVCARLLWIGNEKGHHLETHLTGRILGGTGW